MKLTPAAFVPRRFNAELLQQSTVLHPVLQRVYCSRGIHSFDETEYQLQQLIKPERITHLDSAAGLLARHVMQGSSILVFGDYDDGATSTALCLRALGLMHCKQADFLLPDRVVDGYGLSENVAKRIQNINPALVITVDTGIASFAGIKSLSNKGIDVIVTDHHLPAEELPEASAIVNPNAFAESEGKCLAGVGVAFYLMLALRSELREQGWFDSRSEPNLSSCLDLVSIGTVADLVPLDYNNRILVAEGLKRIRAGACSQGIQKLIQVSRRQLHSFNSQDIGFALAPRINAAGRLDDMSIGVRALLAEDESSAQALAVELDGINAYRRELQGQMTEQAMQLLPDIQADENHHGVVLHQPDWHEGIVGIIASKVKDMSWRPSICFATSDQGLLKGSGRSIPGVHMRDVLDLVDKAHPGMIIRFGGHAMAAGLTIAADSLASFQSGFEQILKQYVDSTCFDPIIEHDGEIEPQYFELDLARLIRDSGPWGQRFPVPSFVGEFKVVEQRIVAERHLKLIVTPTERFNTMEAILFYASPEQLTTRYQTISLHYELSVNEFRDEENLQLLIRHIC